MRLQTQVWRGAFGPLGLMVLALLGAAMVLPGPAEANQFKRIRDVNVSCTNALRCDLFISNPRVTLFSVGFRRAAAFDAPVALYLTLREPLSAGSDVRFVVDGAEVLSVPDSAFSYRAAISEYIYREADDVTALFAAAKAGERLQVVYRTRTGQSTAPFSLSGVVAGSIFMDEVQGRVGRADALTTLGDAPAGSETPPEPGDMAGLDEIPEGLRPYFVGDSAPCADFDGSVPEPLGGFETDLGEGLALIGLRCGSGGAYNLPYAFWERHPEGYRQLALPVMGSDGPTAELLAWNAAWDPETRELSAFFKGRGIGDCGTVTRWSLTDGVFGVGFVLEEMRVKDACDGVFDETMASWEQLWPIPPDKS